MAKKVLVTSRSFGSISDEPLKILSAQGIEFEFAKGSGLLNEEDFIFQLRGRTAIILGNDKVTAEVLSHASDLGIVCKHGTGVDNIDLEAARKQNITITNVPATNSDAVADLTFALMLDVARRVSYASRTVLQGKWAKIVGVDVCNKKLGLIGLGAIGKRVAARAVGFGMKILAFDPMVQTAPAGMDVEMLPFEEVLKQADFLSLHVPLNAHTKNLIGFKEMAMMKKGSFIINASRGGVINEEALYENLKNGQLAGAGLDVTENEPPTGSPLLSLDNVTILPHMGSHSVESINAVSMACAWNVVKFLSGQTPDNIVK